MAGGQRGDLSARERVFKIFYLLTKLKAVKTAKSVSLFLAYLLQSVTILFNFLMQAPAIRLRSTAEVTPAGVGICAASHP